MMDADVIVVGGGVIGTAIAWRAAMAGNQVTLIDPDTDDKASLVAAGMLGPVSESVFGEQDLLTLNLHAIDRFPAFNAELEAASGQDPECLRALFDIGFVLRTPDEVFAKPGLRDKVLQLGAGWRDTPAFGPTREELLSLVSAP